MINIIGLTSIYTYSWSKWFEKSNNEQPIGKTKLHFDSPFPQIKNGPK